MTAVPSPTLGPTGWIAPQPNAVLAGVQADIQASFGTAMNFNLNTPQGQLASSMAALIVNADSIFVYYTQQVDPAFAVGRMQDAIGRIYFLERLPAEPTVVQALCTGLSGTAIPAGATAQAADGNLYTADTGGTIPVGGSITLSFSCSTPGPITCSANSLDTIYQAIPGWDAINNPADGTIGRDVESRAQFEARRAASVAGNAMGFVPAIRGAVLKVPGVLDCYVTENATNAPVTINGVTLAANSVYVCAVGGNDAAVAQAIWTKKAPGCSYNGSTTVVVQDTSAGYVVPFPSYNVSFQRPLPLPILFAANLANNAQVPADAATEVQNAIIAAFSGADGGLPAVIGTTLYASRYYSAVAALGTWAQIISLQIGSDNNTAAVVTASFAGTVMTVTGVTSGTLAVGQTMGNDAGTILSGMRIASFGTGAGGTGTYNMTKAQTLGSGAVKAALANRNSLAVQINQTPTISADNIVVTLT